jgi:hypothetical protein
MSVSGVEKLHLRKHKNNKKDSLQLALALLTKSFRLNFTLNQTRMQNNIPTLYISEIHCCIVKSTKFPPNTFVILYKKIYNFLKI